ncbi:unnamed protein product [Periconia digitata]|uniref:Uncharacterized protein n=1 Tax=Periconia digitata TaxID=1303443 RepID=A0A9W4XW62_9PLEO|nr:unnamed protein product [Periconia digitata]
MHHEKSSASASIALQSTPVCLRQPSMSSAHLCVRNVLTQTFRLPVSRSNAPSITALPDFLVPALSRPRRRPFSSAKRRRDHDEAQTTSHTVAPERLDAVISGLPQKPLPEPINRGLP